MRMPRINAEFDTDLLRMKRRWCSKCEEFRLAKEGNCLSCGEEVTEQIVVDGRTLKIREGKKHGTAILTGERSVYIAYRILGARWISQIGRLVFAALRGGSWAMKGGAEPASARQNQLPFEKGE